MWCAADNHNYMCHKYVKRVFLYLNFNYAVIDKLSNFHEMAPNFTYSQILNFLSIIGKR